MVKHWYCEADGCKFRAPAEKAIGHYEKTGHTQFRTAYGQNAMVVVEAGVPKLVQIYESKVGRVPGDSLLNPKWIVIHGAGTVYRLSIFRFGGDDHELLRDFCGFGEGRNYIGAIAWSNRPKFIFGNPGGYPPDAIRKAGMNTGDFICSVLEVGLWTILNRFDEIPDGSTIEVEPNITAKSSKELYETSKVEIKKGWES